MLRWLRRLAADERLAEAGDPLIGAQMNADDVEFVASMGIRCCDANPLKRPRMAQVVRMLENEDPAMVRERGGEDREWVEAMGGRWREKARGREGGGREREGDRGRGEGESCGRGTEARELRIYVHVSGPSGKR